MSKQEELEKREEEEVLEGKEEGKEEGNGMNGGGVPPVSLTFS